MKTFVLLLCCFSTVLIPQSAYAQKKVVFKKTNVKVTVPAVPWTDESPCEKPCLSQSLWISPDGKQSILLSLMEDGVKISIRDGDDEQVVAVLGNNKTQTFRKRIWLVCEDCGTFKDGGKVMYDSWQDTAVDQGVDIKARDWVTAALKQKLSIYSKIF